MSDITTPAVLSSEDVRRLCGDVLDWKVAAVVETGGTVADLETALARLDGSEEMFGAAPHPLTGAAAQIYDILGADEDFAEEH